MEEKNALLVKYIEPSEYVESLEHYIATTPYRSRTSDSVLVGVINRLIMRGTPNDPEFPCITRAQVITSDDATRVAVKLSHEDNTTSAHVVALPNYVDIIQSAGPEKYQEALKSFAVELITKLNERYYEQL